MVVIKKKKEKSAEEIDAEKHQKDLQKAGIQDEFQAKGFELVEWMQHHKEVVIGFIVALVVGGALLSGWFMFKASANEEASAAYQAAAKLMDDLGPMQADDAKKVEAARAAFAQVVEKFSSSDVAGLASLNIGHLSLRLNDTKGATQAYERFVGAYSSSDKLYPLALTGLANAYEADGQQQKAFEQLEKLSTLAPTLTNDAVLLKMARLAKEAKNDAKVRTSVEELIKRFPDSPLKAEAETLLASSVSH